MGQSLKNILKRFAQLTVGMFPPPAQRLELPLGIQGGKPVRDFRLRPWAENQSNGFFLWHEKIGPHFKKLFFSGKEGLPQDLAVEFAQKWASYCGCKYGLLLPHGTDAIRFALAAALDHDGLDYGGEVIVPNFSFIASATAPLDRRFGIALVDVEPDTLLIDPARVEEAIVPGRTRAIVAVHLFGQPADMDALSSIAKKHNLKLIEDAAQAHGAVWNSSPSGSLGDAAAFSFQSFKNLACGEGGALTTNNETLFERVFSLHNVGRSYTNTQRWEHVELGWNCRTTEYQAVLLLHRFAIFERQQLRREHNFSRLHELLLNENIQCVKPLSVHSKVKRHGMHMFTMRFQSDKCGGITLAEFIQAIQGEGIPVNQAYTRTIAQQPFMGKLARLRPDYIRILPTPVSDQAVNDTVYIPHDVFLGTDNDMRDIVYGLRKVQRFFTKAEI